MSKLKIFLALTALFGCLYLASIGSVERYYGSQRGSRLAIDFYLTKFDLLILLSFVASAVLSIRELIKLGIVREWARIYPRQLTSVIASIVIFALLEHDIWYGTPLWKWSLYLSALVYPILIFSIGKNKGDFLFYALLFVYGVSSITNTISTDQFWVIFPIMFLAAFGRTDKASNKYTLLGMLGMAFLAFYVYRFSVWPEKFFIEATGSTLGVQLFIDTIKSSWVFYTLVISAIISITFALRQSSGKYFQIENLVDGKHIEVYSKTTSYVSQIFVFAIPSHMLLYHLSGAFKGEMGGSLFAGIEFVASAIVIGCALFGIYLSLCQYRNRINLIVHPDGMISFPAKATESVRSLPSGKHRLVKVNIEYQPDSLEDFVIKQRKGDIYFAGGTGPEGAGMLAASVAMTAADGVAKAARGFGEIAGIAMRNHQRKKNGWHVAIHMASESGEPSVLFVESVQKAVADELQKLNLT